MGGMCAPLIGSRVNGDGVGTTLGLKGMLELKQKTQNTRDVK